MKYKLRTSPAFHLHIKACAVQDDSTGKYFAFVNFDTHEAAQKAVKEMHEKELEGSKLYVNRAQTKAERQSILQRRYEQKRSQMAQQMEGKNVYVKNLAPAVDEDKLKAAFAVRHSLHDCLSCDRDIMSRYLLAAVQTM